MSNWEITGLLYQCNARTNEEYKAELRKRQRLMGFLLLLGVFTLAVMITLILLKPELLESYTAGFYTGVGSGLILGGLAGILKIRKTLKNEEAIKKARLAETDEREQAISSRALHATLKILLLAIYLLLLLCSFVTIKATTVLCLLICIFILGYFISRKIYSKNM